MSERRRKVDWDNGQKKKYKQTNEEEGINPWTGAPFSSRYYSILKTRTKLPVYQFKDDLIQKVMENQCVVVEGETGE